MVSIEALKPHLGIFEVIYIAAQTDALPGAKPLREKRLRNRCGFPHAWIATG